MEGRRWAGRLLMWMMMVAAFTTADERRQGSDGSPPFLVDMEQHLNSQLAKMINRPGVAVERPAPPGNDVAAAEVLRDEGRDRHLEESWRSVEEELAWEYERTQSALRMRAASEEANGRSSWLTADVQCLVARHTNSTSQMRILEWLCSSWGANHDCSGIMPGGPHNLQVGPNLTDEVLKHHLEWALSSYHETKIHEAYPYQTCWFHCFVYLNPPPLNFFFLGIKPNKDGITNEGFFSQNGFRVCEDGGTERRISIRSNQTIELASESLTAVRNG
ncbi:hypothetical protein GUITHDRAFT_140387 [Guillardia theta CCMP2712]|uniref:Uncharacterized protein n=1 Tax=Guillardia theta (strain CCMP2712) TaxID=905079 RepID=L1J549_GUITC|nr:hypothetical protein GUITHDRAFT_140387 [Guillardia theta CCMP2712]EKX43636.1 hypothetical protein GUITHDRAFT_140387 [Guillardia theta CCMP2712]|eukprot:XP_005830616.1 hypothetical protein GUITHDRAFT_140387 [Guillardia theta CCMP2712]